MEKDILSTNGVGTTGYAHARRRKKDPQAAPHALNKN